MRAPRTGERGAALAALVALVLLAALAGLVHSLEQASRSNISLRKAEETRALNAARQALVAFAAANRNRPGGLPCPDRDGDGEAELACDRSGDRLGWLPWQTLGVGDLRDASGGRLAYALAYTYRNDADAIINPATAGELHVPARGWRDLAAVVIAPGAALPGQSRIDPRRIGDFVEASMGGGRLDVDAASNDVHEPLAAASIWAAVDPVVGERIEREVAPYFMREVVGRWHAVPHPAEFAPESTGPIAPGVAGGPGGALPATRDPGWVGWDLASVRVEAIAGTGMLVAARCERSIASELRCELEHSGPLRLRLQAQARNVAFALVTPSTIDDLGPASLGGRTVKFGAIEADGSALATAEAELPAHAATVRLTLRAPPYVGPLTDARTPVAHPLSWFARNGYARFVYLARADTCPPACLTVQERTAAVTASAVLVYTGRGRPDLGTRLLARYLDGLNARSDTQVFERRPAVPGANDLAIALCRDGICTP